MTDKKIKEEIKQVVTNLCNIEFTVEDGLKFCKEILKRKEQECKNLKQTLTEIKEISKNMNEECFYDDFDCMNCDMQNGCTYINKKQILQKISESEVDNER